MTMFASIYFLYLTLIDSCMHMYFLNRVRDLFFFDKFWILEWFWDGGGISQRFLGFVEGGFTDEEIVVDN
jgi:hypothetical protein